MLDDHAHPHPGWETVQAALPSDEVVVSYQAITEDPPLNTPVDMSVASRLIGAAVAGCWECQEELFDEVVEGDPRVTGHLMRYTYHTMFDPIGKMVANHWLAEDYVVATLASWYGKKSLPILRAAASNDYVLLHRLAKTLTSAERAEILDGMLDTLSTWIVLPVVDELSAQWENTDAC